MINAASLFIWIVSAATIAAILLRPGKVAEWIWAVAGAAIVVSAGLLPLHDAGAAAADGIDVYLFLGGMLALSELARVHGVFEWLAALLLKHNARASAGRMLLVMYAAGVVITALLSNDSTILLLTPAAYAVAVRARVQPLPFLYASAFVANAASFVLPVSNPANLVLFHHLPSVGPWLAAFGFASLAAVVATYLLLHAAMQSNLGERIDDAAATPVLSRAGTSALAAVLISAVFVILAAAFERPVGATAAIFGAASTIVVTLFDMKTPLRILRETSWSIVPLVASLFVIVRALDRSGVLHYTRQFFHFAGALPGAAGSLLAGGVVGIADNVLNNLPAGVIARYSVQANVPPHVVHAALVGLDLGPNLSVSGSLATLLWLIMLRREGVQVTPWQFLRIGTIVTIPSLALALLAVR